MKKGLVQIYTGDGKGKTTAALGLALRSLGHQKKVCIIQFMKKGSYGEFKAIKKIPKVVIRQFGTKKLVRKGKISKIDINQAQWALKSAQRALLGQYDLVILDEVIVAVHFGLISEPTLIQVIKDRSKKTELILTGRKASAKLKDTADLVTEMKELKHYYKKGVKARLGIEY